MNESGWLSTLKAGDSVVIDAMHGDVSLNTVDRVTPTLIIIGRHKYRRANGKLISTYKWSYNYLRPPTPERLLAIRRREACNRLLNFQWSQKPDALLFAVDDLVQAFQQQKPPSALPEDGR